MKRNLRDSLAGFVVGVIFFFGPGFLGTGWFGYDFLINTFPALEKIGFFLTSMLYILAGIFLFLIYAITPLYKKRDGYTKIGSVIISFIFYSIGICVSFVGVILAIIAALNNADFPV